MASGNTRGRQGSGTRSSAQTGRRTQGAAKSAQRKSSARASSSGKKNRSGGRSAGRQEPAVGNEIVLILSFAFCILLFLCNFSIMGLFGRTVKGVMFGLFGVLFYVIPVALFVGIAFHISNAGRRGVKRKLAAAAVLLWCIGIFAEMIAVPMEKMTGNLIVDLFQESKDGLKGGGLFCGLPAYPMMKYLTRTGSMLVLLVIVIISLVVITERSLINGVKNGSRRVYDTAKESAERRREERAMRYEEEDEYDEEEEEEEQPERPQGRAGRRTRIDRVSQEMRRTEPDDRTARAAERNRERARGVKKEEEQESLALRVDKKVSGVSGDTTLVKKQPETIHRENMHEITLADIPVDEPLPEESSEVANGGDGAFAFDLYRDMPEPKGKDVVREEAGGSHISGTTADMHEIGMSESGETPEKDDYRPRGADTFGQSLESGYQPQKPGHSFGVKEEYKTPDEKKAAEAVIPNVKPVLKPQKYIFPPLTLLKKKDGKSNGDSARQLKETAARLQQTLKTFGVNVTITDISQGPTVTRYEMQPELGVKVSKIVSLADDIKLNLAATDIRIEAPIPGKAAVGIEVPNKENSAVNLRELLESDAFKNFQSSIAFAVGKDIGGQTVVFDIGKMPHVLIAGSTGSGKSVCINTLIMSILYKAHPNDVKLIMVDPKVVELSVYNGIPHLLIPVVTDPKKASAALQWAVAEMTDRYKKFADHNVRDLKGYNKLAEDAADPNDPSAPVKMPQIVIIVDELADLMMVASNEVEEAIVRLAQLARAAGIHLVIATQRPSVDIITGLIKANMPSRIAFAVSSGVDSRTILDMNGAEKLLGKGDMLFYPQGYSKPARVQGAFVSDKEVSDVVDFLKNQSFGNVQSTELEEKISHMTASSAEGGSYGGAPELDELFADAGRMIIEDDKASIGMLQRAFRIGFNRAARIMDQLSDAGVVSEGEGTKPRKVMMSPGQFEQYLENR